MPLWVILFILSLCFTSMTGVYLLRQNGRNGHKNGNGNGHTLSQMTKAPDPSSSGEPPSQEVKPFLIPSLPAEKQEEGEEIHVPVLSERKKISNDPSPPDEDPHDHQEDHQQEPPPALRERRRMVVRPREDEEEDEGDQSPQSEVPPAQESFIPTNKTLPFENGTLEEWQHDEDVVDTLIVKKEAETQTIVFQSEKGAQAYPDMRDEDAQISTVLEQWIIQESPSRHDEEIETDPLVEIPSRVNHSLQAIPETIEEGVEPSLLSFENKGIGGSLITSEKAVGSQLSLKDQGIGKSIHLQDISVGTPLERFNQSLQFQPSFSNKSIQENPLLVSRGMSARNLITSEKGIGKSLEEKSEGIQYSLQRDDQSVQRTFSQRSIGAGSQGLKSFRERDIQTSFLSKKSQEILKSLDLSEIPPFREKSNPFFSGLSSVTITSDPEDLRKIDIPRTTIGKSSFVPADMFRKKTSILILPRKEDEEKPSPYFKVNLPVLKLPDLDDLKIPKSLQSLHLDDMSEVKSEWVLRSRISSSSALTLKNVEKEKEDISFPESKKSIKRLPSIMSIDDLSFDMIENGLMR